MSICSWHHRHHFSLNPSGERFSSPTQHQRNAATTKLKTAHMANAKFDTVPDNVLLYDNRRYRALRKRQMQHH
jgi:hypothetical protein